MKNIAKLILGACISSSVFMTGCIDETFPTSGATEDQLTSSEKALDAMVWAMPAYFNTFQLLPSRQDYDWGYGSLMHIRDVQTGDMAVAYSGSGYDWYEGWSTLQGLGEDYMMQQYTWWYYYKFIQTANNVIAVIEINIIEPHGFKEVAFCLAIGFPEQFKVLIQSAVVFGDRHLVIVDDYDHIGSGLSGIIKAFICFAAGEGTVADNGDNVIIFAFQIACFSDAACQTYRG